MKDSRTQTNIDTINGFIKKYGKLKKKKFKVKLFGIDTFGCEIADKLATTNIKNIDMYGLNCDKELLQNCFANLKHKILIGKKVTKGLACSDDNELAKEALLSSENQIKNLMKDAHVLFLVISHDSAFGRNSLFHFADWANELGIALFIIILTPKNPKKPVPRRKLEVRNYNIEGQTLYAVPYRMIVKKTKSRKLNDDFKCEFTNVAIEQIFKGILKRVANIDNIYGDLK